MSTDVEQALATTGGWPVDDQLDLLHGLWDRLTSSGWQPTLSDERKTELDRRLDDLDANPNNVLTWAQVEDQLRQRP